MVHGKCPRCHEGEVFKNRNPYHSLAFAKMYEHCKHCGQSFDPEPGFYQGAMYVSYALTLGVTLPVGLILLLVLNASLFWILGILTVILLVMLPVIFRLSRLVWLNFFIPYRPLESEQKRP